MCVCVCVCVFVTLRVLCATEVKVAAEKVFQRWEEMGRENDKEISHLLELGPRHLPLQGERERKQEREKGKCSLKRCLSTTKQCTHTETFDL